VEDIDLDLEEFVSKINSDLIGKVVNIASRSARFVAGSGLSPQYPEDGGLFAEAAAQGDAIAQAYEAGDYSRAMRIIMDLADKINPYIETHAPWDLNKDPAKSGQLQDVCTVALNVFRQLVIYLAPVLPGLVAKTDALLSVPITSWNDSKQPLVGIPVNKFQHMMRRVDPAKVQAMIQEGQTESAAPPPSPAQSWADDDAALKAEPIAPEITIDDFAKVDLRVARILEANEVPEARKLVQLTLGLGGQERRRVYAGIKAAYQPKDLIGRLVVVVANLAPRKMKFGVSEGMVVASGPGGEEIFLLSPDQGAKPGQRVH
jgi:methionyl-tRNA synthetase